MRTQAKFIKYLTVLASLIALSCDTTTVIELPKNPPTLTLNCIGESGKPWRAKVSLSTDILQFPTFTLVQNATANIYENGKLTETLVNGNFDGGFDLNYGAVHTFPKPGNTYRIVATTAQYGTVSATYVQPMPVEVDNLELTVLGFNKGIDEYARDVEYKLMFRDPPEENFYQIAIVRKSEDSDYAPYAQQHNLSLLDPAYKENNEIFYGQIFIAFSDHYFNGSKTSLVLKSFIQDPPDRPPLNYYTVYLNHISKEYYLYLKTIALQNLNLKDPFSQPVLVEKNVDNGFGIVGGYTQTVKTFYLGN